MGDFSSSKAKKKMENYLNENFGDVKPKNSSDEALQRWRKLCWIVKNPKRRFRFTANLTKRSEAEAIRRSNQVLLTKLKRSLSLSLSLLLTVGDLVMISCVERNCRVFLVC